MARVARSKVFDKPRPSPHRDDGASVGPAAGVRTHGGAVERSL